MKVKNYIDDSYFLMMTIPFLTGLILAFIVILMNQSKLLFILGIVSTLFLIILFFTCFFRIYEFDKKEMKISYGFIKKKFKYKDIKKCYITDDKALSYATSKRKLCIEFKKDKKIYISPVKMDEILLMLLNKMEGKKK